MGVRAAVCGEVRFLPPVTIHQFPLDGNPCSFYSVRIFDTLAPLANPVAVPKAHHLRCNQSPVTFHPISQIVRYVFNPVPPDGGQHTT